MNEIIFLIVFIVFIAFALALDLGVFNKNSHVISFKESLMFSSLWVVLALLFFVFLRYGGHLLHNIDNMSQLAEVNLRYGHHIDFKDGATFAENLQLYRNQMSLEFITGYVIEYAMSIDNIFVMLLIFTSFGVEQKYYHRVLFWGIIGAVVMRFAFIFILSGLVHKFAWILAIFGVILIYTAIKMFVNRNKQQKVDIENNKVVKFVSKHFAVTSHFSEGHFFVKENGKKMITPLLLVLLIVEGSDVIFAVDSVPAIFSITQDQYLVFFSNIFAIVGLRSLFFMLSSLVNLFHYLKSGLSVLLAFVGVKILLESFTDIHISVGMSLAIILSVIVLCILLSLIFPPKDKQDKLQEIVVEEK